MAKFRLSAIAAAAAMTTVFAANAFAINSKAATHAAVGSDAYDFSLHHAKGGFVQPMALTRGYAKAAKAAGARVIASGASTRV